MKDATHPAKIDFETRVQALLAEEPVMIDKVSAATNLSPAEVPIMLGEVLKFLALIAWSKKRLTPTMPIDLAWHEFILFTRTYAAYCDRYHGRFMHHHPGGSEAENRHQFHQTIRLYRLVFGQPPQPYWGALPELGAGSDCGGCEG